MAIPLWTPSFDSIKQCNLTRFMAYLKQHGHSFSNYMSLYHFSINQPALFWQYVWEFAGFVSHSPYTCVLEHTKQLEKAVWFKGATLNFAENLLRRRDNKLAIVSYDERGRQQKLSYAELYVRVANLSNWLKAKGVTQGDRVAGFMPNIAETVISMLAVTSLGAIWSSCSPDFGFQGVLDRFGQITPKVIITTDAYIYNGKTQNNLERINRILPHIDSVEYLVVVPYINVQLSAEEIKQQLPLIKAKSYSYSDIQALAHEDIVFTSNAFEHPLYIMYSSGTTGVPKCIVHDTGGTLLQHYKELVFHTDLTDKSTIFYYTTCGWMMWNWLVSSLMTGACIVLYDGSPFSPSPEILWDIAEKEKVTVFGTSAKYISALEKAGVKPRMSHNLSHLKTVLSTGSPLVHESFDYVYQEIKSDLCLSSISGGTDIISCFALGCPILPVYRGELQCIGLGMSVQVLSPQGKSLIGHKDKDARGELVCTKPFPSMPVYFWNDPARHKYHEAYFSRYDNIWAQGDYAELVEHESQIGVIIYGRSDAVLNPGGVRIGTAEIYRQVEKVDDVLESIAVGQAWEGDVRIILFVVLRDGKVLQEELIHIIKQTIKDNTTQRHVPAKIIQVSDIPKTISGKIVELAVRNVIHNLPVNNTDALKNPESLAFFKHLPELSS
ncbi:acetoacetate--CoA ligase [uncultured Shewanella sp.]|uniref:acetoacetate--CoA ligase n=1 Tax=uncultured Shewanella sp. TaxID=173975 RepID=UPI0026060473|nr:acetoacetate--CoA ligase [uncultured Shewanella sp.]